MNITPRRQLGNFFRDDDWFFPVFPSREFSEPEMDIYETDKDVVAKVSLPEIDPNNVKVSVEDDVLMVEGDFGEEDEEKEKNYYRKEIRRGSFQKAVRLPAEVDENKAKADYKKGVLEIVLPKTEPKEKKKKEIKVNTK